MERFDHIHHVAVNDLSFFLRDDGSLDIHFEEGTREPLTLNPRHAYALHLFMRSPVVERMIASAAQVRDNAARDF